MLSNLSRTFYRTLATAKKAKGGAAAPASNLKLTDQILQKLKTKYGYDLFHAEVNNLGWKHDEPKDSEKFLELIVVTPKFETVKKEKRLQMIKEALKDELKKVDEKNVTFKLLTPSKWYDSNQRGLKLDEIYSEPPVFGGELEQVSKQFYMMVEKTAIKQDGSEAKN